MTSSILAVNAGSSSLKFKLFATRSLDFQQSGKVTGIGSKKGTFEIADRDGKLILSKKAAIKTEQQAVEMLMDWLSGQRAHLTLEGIGHRIVHGGNLFYDPVLIDRRMLRKLKSVEKLAPLHLPDALSNLATFLKIFPETIQVASFDTAFHKNLPDCAKYYALPARVRKAGVQRYGFHGLSCEYITGYLRKTPDWHDGKKIIIAHLGSGSSVTAVMGEQSIETTMGFTPAGGLMMSTRSGELDPGIASFLLRHQKMSAQQLDELFNKQAGLLGISAKTGDISKLLQQEATHAPSALAVDMFCYGIKKAIGQMAAVLNGADELVFTGGIGEHVAAIRERVCQDMDYLNLQLDSEFNCAGNAEIISSPKSKVRVRIIATNEEYILAQNVNRFLEDKSLAL